MGEMFDAEQLVFCSDRHTGLRAVIAIDDTRLGPAMGGVRLRPYPSDLDAAGEAIRLAAGMTLKNAAAGLPFGGGKSVIIADRSWDGANRAEMMRAFGRFVARLGGAYIPGVDMGTSVSDLATVATVAPRVACHDSDPSPWTALGVHAGLLAAVRHLDGTGRMRGQRVAIQGAGHVGAELARLLAADGAHVIIGDIDPARARTVAALVGGHAVAAEDILTTPCDVLAPCAVAKIVDSATVPLLRCRILAGAANDQLAERDAAGALAQAGILYVPDFVINAGGVIQIHAAAEQWDDHRLRAEVLAIGDRVAGVLDDTHRRAALPLVAAEALAHRRLNQPALAAALA
ncbi:MAG: Leu/Phe/Val dehydrogenase [Haloechinothrix sp.]